MTPTAPAKNKLYDTARWRQLRKSQLEREPLCRLHEAIGKTVEGKVVDHIVPHRGSVDLFFDADNLQTLCKPCHDGHKQAQEHSPSGLMRGAAHDGAPLDLAHPWHGVGGRGPSESQSPRRPVPNSSAQSVRMGRGGSSA